MGNKKIRGHSKNNFKDVQSISLIKNILSSHGKIMPKLDEIDKWPNIDGHLEFLNDDGSIRGRMYVQVKTLPEQHNFKFPCPVDFLTHCEIEPCLLFLVDNYDDKVYWSYYDIQVIREIDFKGNSTSKTIAIDKKKFFSKKNDSYLDDWKPFLEKNQKRYREYDKLKADYELILKNTNPIMGVNSVAFKNIHIFLDAFNGYLDNDFPIVKRLFYTEQWKIGLAYNDYSKESLSYILYPIGYDKNDVQIKEIDDNLKNQVKRLEFSLHTQENPLIKRPKGYAQEILQNKVFKILESKMLDLSGIEIIAREYIVAFIDEFYLQMGLENSKDTYNYSEVQEGFSTFLPLWLEESHQFLLENNRNNYYDRVQEGRIAYLDPDEIFSIRVDEQKEIQKKVVKRIKNGELSKSNLPMGNRDFSFSLFQCFLSSFKGKSISRIYKKKDYSNLEKKSSNKIWDIYTEEDTRFNFEVVISNIIKVYEKVIENNFPRLKDEISLFENNTDTVIYCLKNDNALGPKYESYKLKSIVVDEAEKKIIVISPKELEEVNSQELSKTIHFRGKEYKALVRSSGILDFPYEKTPLMNYIYELLERRLKKFFKI